MHFWRLYVGVSMLSLLQLATIFYNMHKKHKEEVASGNTVKKNVVATWAVFIFKYMARSFDFEKTDVVGQLDLTKRRFDQMMQRIDEIENLLTTLAEASTPAEWTTSACKGMKKLGASIGRPKITWHRHALNWRTLYWHWYALFYGYTLILVIVPCSPSYRYPWRRVTAA